MFFHRRKIICLYYCEQIILLHCEDSSHYRGKLKEEVAAKKDGVVIKIKNDFIWYPDKSAVR